MDDLISRQAAIDALARTAREKFNLSDEFNYYLAGLIDGEMAIQQLPSAQPEIIRCKDCKHWDTTWESDRTKNCHYCPFIDGTSTGDWYCADAERRTDETD